MCVHSYVHPMVANQHTLMHVDGEDNTNQPHAYGRIPGARIKDRITRWRQMQVRGGYTQRSTAYVAGLPAHICRCVVLPLPTRPFVVCGVLPSPTRPTSRKWCSASLTSLSSVCSS